MKMKIVAIILGISMAMTIAACGSQTDSQTENQTQNQTETEVSSDTTEVVDDITGGWESNQGSLAPEDNPEAKAAFEKATEDLVGYDYELIAYLGSQVVAGTNYSFLCKGTVVVPDAEAEYLIATVYEDLDGNAEITGTKSLLDVDEENTEGGWSYNQGDASLDSNTDVKAAFETALDGLDGSDYDPIAYIGSQTVSGTNYAIICGVTPVVPDAERTFCLVTVYEDLEGNADIAEVTDIDLSAEDDTAETDESSQIANPFTEVATLDKAAEITGFTLTVPDAPEDYPDMIIRVMDQTMIEVIYENAANETGDGIDEAYRIRKAVGSEDISGDYNEYENVSTQTIGSNEVTLKGNGENVSVAVWVSDGYTYAVDAEDNPLTSVQIEEIVSAVR